MANQQGPLHALNGKWSKEDPSRTEPLTKLVMQERTEKNRSLQYTVIGNFSCTHVHAEIDGTHYCAKDMQFGDCEYLVVWKEKNTMEKVSESEMAVVYPNCTTGDGFGMEANDSCEVEVSFIF